MSFRIDDRPAGFRIDPFGPSHLGKWLRGYKRAGNAIQHIIEPILVGLHEDLALPSVNGEIHQDESLDAVIVPGVAWNRLVIPLQLTVIGLYGQDGTNKEVVLALGLPKLFRPRTTISCADINEIRLGVICHAVPNRSAAAELPPFARPGFGCFLQRWILEGFGGIAGYRIEAPRQLSCVGVVCPKKPADRKFG